MPFIGNLFQKQQSLGRKMVVYILLINALLSVVAASVQLFLSYQRDKSRVISSVEIIDQSFRRSFEDALWEYNYGLLNALLDGVFNREDVAFVKLDSSDGQKWSLGEEKKFGIIFETLPLTQTNKNNELFTIGELTIGLSLENVQQRVWAQFWTLILSNFVKTAIASFLLLILFNRLITRHLKKISRHVEENAWLKDTQKLMLERKQTYYTDDLDSIVSAINTAKAKSVTDYKALIAEIAQRRQAEYKLAAKAANLEQANREQAEFTYAISHDLKSPVNTVEMLLNELESSYSLTDDGRSLIEVAQDTTKRMSKLIEDTLRYSRAVDEKFTPEPVNLNTIFTEIFDDLRADIFDSQAKIECDSLPPIEGSPYQLRMVFQNLISNALKFKSPDKAPIITIRYDNNKDNLIKISISDNGIGIDPKYHHKIFGLFQRLYSHQEYSGSGIGLALCQRVVTNHEGKIQVESAVGKGTTFHVYLRRYYDNTT